jgi:ferric-dicitrate binding protein FerR (iron transport regulator)
VWNNRSQDDEREIERLLRAAHDTPAEPMSEAQIREVLERAAAGREECAPFPASAFVFMAGCLVVVVGSLLPTSDDSPAARTTVALLLASNVALSPLTAVAIAWRRRRQYER